MKQSKLILFDWGGIVDSHKTGYSFFKAYQDVFSKLGYTGEDILESKILDKYDITSARTLEELETKYNQIKADLRLSGNFEDFKQNFLEHLSKTDYYPEVSSYETSLKDRCSIGILSNLIVLDKERISKQLKLEDYDYLFFSFDLGLSKPNPQIYSHINEQVSISPENILFLDDTEANVAAAKNAGWKSACVSGLELPKIKEYCEAFLQD